MQCTQNLPGSDTVALLSFSNQKPDTATLQRVFPVCKRDIAVHGNCPPAWRVRGEPRGFALSRAHSEKTCLEKEKET